MDAAILDTINKRIDDQSKLMNACVGDIKDSNAQVRDFMATMDKKLDDRITEVDDKYEKEVTSIKSDVSCCVTFKRRLITIGQVAAAAFVVITTIVGLAQRW
ncbi:hypothetical protein M0R72_06095 [Candidatus Pacearchaeota archaeon]|nr:hypothetical protein [Candidatus Pacearchaeota archaeon]